MKAITSLLVLLACVGSTAIAATADQTLLPSKKVVFTGTGPARLNEKEIQELREIAPSLNIVFPERENISKEIVDADAVIGSITAEQVRSAKKLKWVQITSAGVENYLLSRDQEQRRSR